MLESTASGIEKSMQTSTSLRASGVTPLPNSNTRTIVSPCSRAMVSISRPIFPKPIRAIFMLEAFERGLRKDRCLRSTLVCRFFLQQYVRRESNQVRSKAAFLYFQDEGH